MSWKPEYIILIIISTLVNYFSAILLDKTDHVRRRRLILASNLLIGLGILFAFKYFNVFSQGVREFLGLFSIPFTPLEWSVLLPVGISFYTFQTLSYTIDVYNRKIKPERHLGIFAVYVAFFPQLVAGPIERAKNLLPQFLKEKKFEYKRATNGLKLMLWGFFKKVVIADRLAIVVDVVYNNPTDFGGGTLILATFFFVFQIYCDFSGYSDIAIGSAQIMGISLMDNFKRPFHAKNITEFWRRWHISMTTWFKDYVFTPLYIKISRYKRFAHLEFRKRHHISFVFSTIVGLVALGFWHGPQLTYGVFGLYQGLMIIFYYYNKSWWDRMNKYVQIVLTFLIFSFSNIFFRANSLTDAYYIITHLFSGLSLYFYQGIRLTIPELTVAVGSIIFMEFIHLIQRHVGMRRFLNDKPLVVRWGIYLIILSAILVFGVFGHNEFIYFQF